MKRTIVFTKQAQKDAKKLIIAGLRPKAEELLEILKENPLRSSPSFHKLGGRIMNEEGGSRRDHTRSHLELGS